MCLQQGRFPQEAVRLKQDAKTKDADATGQRGVLCCAACQAPITSNAQRIAVNERHEHVFANPHGYIFHIGCFAAAPGCMIMGEATEFFTWFPGYRWQLALCGRCGDLLGWAFRSADARFFGLILDKLRESEERHE